MKTREIIDRIRTDAASAGTYEYIQEANNLVYEYDKAVDEGMTEDEIRRKFVHMVRKRIESYEYFSLIAEDGQAVFFLYCQKCIVPLSSYFHYMFEK